MRSIHFLHVVDSHSLHWKADFNGLLPVVRAMRIRNLVPVLSLVGYAVLPLIAQAGEFYVGEPIVQDNLQIVPNYLTASKWIRCRRGWI